MIKLIIHRKQLQSTTMSSILCIKFKARWLKDTKKQGTQSLISNIELRHFLLQHNPNEKCHHHISHFHGRTLRYLEDRLKGKLVGEPILLTMKPLYPPVNSAVVLCLSFRLSGKQSCPSPTYTRMEDNGFASGSWDFDQEKLRYQKNEAYCIFLNFSLSKSQPPDAKQPYP